MKINDIEYMVSAYDRSRLIKAGATYTEADTYAGPGVGLADAVSFAAGRHSSATTQTYTSARTTRYSQHSAGVAGAQAYGANGAFSNSASFSRYRATSFFGNIQSTNSFSSSFSYP